MNRLSRWLLCLPVRRPGQFLPARCVPPSRFPALHLTPLEAREVPAGTPVTAVGAAPGSPPEVRLLDTSGVVVRSFLAYDAAFTGGVRTALADLDRDGVLDVVTAPGAGTEGVVRVFSGATGDLVTQITPYPGFASGVTLAAGDIGTGERGIVTGADAGGGPRVQVFNAAGELRRNFFAYAPDFRGGVSVALGYAADGNATVVTAPGAGGGPHVRLFEARSGADAGGFFAYDPAFRGGATVAAADLSGDGVSEIVTGAGAGGAAHVRVFNTSGVERAGFFAADPSARDGVAVGVAGGPDGQSRVAAVLGAGRTLTTFDRLTDATPVATAGGASGVGGVSGPAIAPRVSRYDDADPVPRQLRQPQAGSAPSRSGGGTSTFSDYPVRYGDGVVQFAQTDINAGGFGSDWGVSRSWTNEQAYSQGQTLGRGWIVAETPSLVRQGVYTVQAASQSSKPQSPAANSLSAGGETLSVVQGGSDIKRFRAQADGSFLAVDGILDALAFDATAGQYTMTSPDGGQLSFWDFDAAKPAAQQGSFAKRLDPKGNLTQVTTVLADGRVGEVQRTGPGAGGTVTESYLYAYVASGANAGLTGSITQRRKVGAGAWSTVRLVEYAYYDGVEASGNAKDLKKVVVKDGAGVALETSYFRYYKPGEAAGYDGGLKLAFTPKSYARLANDVATPEAATDAAVAAYADNRFEYNDLFRVTQEVAAGAGGSTTGGLGTFTYAYTPFDPAGLQPLGTVSGNATVYNAWTTRTVETLPDGNANTVYTNGTDQVMLRVFRDAATGQQWRWFHQYDAGGRLVLSADPSAVTGFDEAKADLLDNQAGNYTYLADGVGLVTVQEFGATSTATPTAAGDAAGRVRRVSLRRGETGVAVPQADLTYIKRTVGATDLFFEAGRTQYRNADGTGGQTTATAYTWQGATAEPASVTVTLPTVTAAQNGPATASSVTTLYDAYGRPSWSQDADGFLTYAEYDQATGAVVKHIADIDTTLTATFAGLPSGWVTPAGGGLHLTTAVEVDNQGRATKTAAPNGRVDYATYNDAAKEVRVYAGWDAAANLPTGPTRLTRADWARGYAESLSMAATPAVAAGRPTGAEAVGSLQTLSRVAANAAGQAVTSDRYFDLGGLTYTTAAALGAAGTNFDRTATGYDASGRADRSVSPTGTISRTLYDGPGRPVSQWVGLDDVPTAGAWSPANAAGTDLVKVSETQYDGGLAGDGNPTRVTQFPGGAAANRVTDTAYDWRNRPVAVKAGVEASESAAVNRPIAYTVYDNLNQQTLLQRYDGDGVTVADANADGVPDAPAAGLLRAQSGAGYDELGRAFRAEQFSVDPATGAVGANTLKADTWLDRRGNAIKVTAPGRAVEKTAYDGVGRAVTVSTTDGGGDATWADAANLTGDTVLGQVTTQYDAGGNALLVTRKDRFHDATGTGALGTASTGVKARVSSSAAYYDLADRPTDAVDVGTNAAAAYARPATVPARSDTVLVSSTTYDAAGRAFEVTDPRGLKSRTTYDALGRVTKTVENYADGVPSNLDDKTTEFTYSAAGRTGLTARLAGGGGQTTAWVYGATTAAGSGVNSNDVLVKTQWPDEATGAASATQQETTTVNALGEPVTTADRNGNTHTLAYDALGRGVSDTLTLLGVNVDGAVRRVETAYDAQGNAALSTGYSAAAGGAVTSQTQRDFNGLGQLTSEWQAVGAAVTGATPRVQYAYSEMAAGANHSRPTSTTYPNGRVVTSVYAAGTDDAVSRLSSLTDASGTLESYAYLGLDTVVRRSHPLPGVDLTFVKQGAEADGSAGDQYSGLDRFGRVVDQRWVKTSTGAATDRFQYGYDRGGDRLFKDNLVGAAFGEVYAYDGLDQVASFARGTLNAGQTAVAGTPSRTQAWSPDAVGNFDAVTTNGVAQARTTNRQNEVLTLAGATSPTYDANGNLTKDESGRRSEYDGWNRPVRVKDAAGTTTLASYAYDGAGRRVTVTAGAVTTQLVYSSQWQVLEERVGGVAKAQNVWSPVYVDALVVRDRDADGNAGTGTGGLEERLWVQQDANFNVTALTDGTGAAVERFVYDPFGAATVLTGAFAARPASLYAWQYLHQGGRVDGASGLVNFRHRDYSPTLGRWVTVDPIEYDAGDTNLFRAVGNNPLGYTDPSGLQKKKDPPKQETPPKKEDPKPKPGDPAPGDGPGELPKPPNLKKDQPPWGHIFRDHGDQIPQGTLDDRARPDPKRKPKPFPGGPEGQFTKNKDIADIVNKMWKELVVGPNVIPLPDGLGKVTRPSGAGNKVETVPTDKAIIVIDEDGNIITGYPLDPKDPRNPKKGKK